MKKNATRPPVDASKIPLFRKFLCCLLIGCLCIGVARAQDKTAGDMETKKISLEFVNSTLDQALTALEKASGFRLIYPSEPVDKAHLVNLPKEERTIAATLQLMLKGTSLDFRQSGNTIVLFIKKEAPAAQEPQGTPAKNGMVTLHGVVTDGATGEPMSFASVVGQRTKGAGDYTSDKGEFTLNVPADETHIVVSFIGYKNAVVAIGQQRNFQITLAPDAVQLDETVVVGYQTRKKSTLTGSVKALDADKISEIPVANFDAALQGQVAGVYVSSSGNPGHNGRIYIRGINSISSGREPLYILDGTQISTENFATLNPNDIESYTVLKDASATSIYGSLAANGVVLLTSKRGKSNERSEVSYSFQGGVSSIVPRKFTMMNTAQLLQYQEDLGLRELDPTGKYYLYRNGAGDIMMRESKDSLMAINTNWEDEIFRTAWMQSHDLSLRGGNDNTRYYASLNYFSQDGIMPSSYFNRLSLRTNLDHNISKAVKVGVSSFISRDNRGEVTTGSNNINSNPLVGSYMYPPYLRARNDDGELIDFPTYRSSYRNILLYYDNYTRTSSFTKIVANVFAELNLAPWLKFKSTVGVDNQNGTQFESTNPSWYSAYNGVSDPETDGSVRRAYSGYMAVTNNNVFTLLRSFGNHNFNWLLGEESLYAESLGFSARAQGLYDDDVMTLSAASTPLRPTDSETEWSTLSFFTQMSYNYLNKYFVDFSFRADGSSRFSANSRWAPFWSVGVSWNAKREEFLKDLKTITSLNVFASTGTSGNADFGSNPAYNIYSYNTSYDDIAGLTRTQIANEDLVWEKVWKNNLGVEATFVDRFRVKVEGYYNITSDMLLYVPISNTYGVSGQWQNAGKLRNTGAELEVEFKLYQTQDMSWSVRGNVAYNQTRVLKLSALSQELDYGSYITAEGVDYGMLYLTRYAGVDPLTGQPLWYTKDDKITATYSDDDRVMLDKKYIPDFTGGFGTDFSYKRFGASLFFAWTGSRYMLNTARNNYNSNGRYANEYNQSTDMLDYWKTPGDITPFYDPKYAQAITDTRVVENAAYLRLKDVKISYGLDPVYLAKTKLIKSARVYLQATNLLTFTSYTGFDPETPVVIEPGNYPHSRSFTLGIDLKF